MKKTIIIILIVILVGVGVYFLTQSSSENTYEPQEQVTENQQEENMEQVPEENMEQEVAYSRQSQIGKSALGKNILAYHFGNGDTELLFVGGIHGAYSWNTSAVAYELIDYLNEEENILADNLKVTVIPALNPDGLSKVISDPNSGFSSSDVSGTSQDKIDGRFNGNNVDLNRNFDCDWQAVGKWQDKNVDGGDSAFSEPESQAVKSYVESNNPDAVVVWYSSVGGVFASNCHNGVMLETTKLTNIYAKASGYPAFEKFDFYEITGDMVNWLAKKEIPAISVLLSTHDSVEWSKNQAGIQAVIDYYKEN